MSEQSPAPVLHEEPHPSLLSSVLVIAGFITLIAIVLWGLLHIATLASPWLGDLFQDKKAPAIEITAPAGVVSGDNFTMSWKHTTTAEGMYTLLYQCKDNLRLEMEAGGAMRAVPCGAAITVSSPDKSIQVRPVLSGTATTSVAISIVFMPNKPVIAGTTTGTDTASEQAQGNAIVMIYPRSTPTVTTAKPTTTPVATTPAQPPVKPIYVPQTTAPAPTHVATPADLSVRIVSINIDPSGMGAVEFDIANVGGSRSGAYTFEVFLPTQSGYTYSSTLQSPLGPGDHVANTLRFSQGVSGTVSIVVDSNNALSESNKNNNYASQQVTSYYNPQYPYVY